MSTQVVISLVVLGLIFTVSGASINDITNNNNSNGDAHACAKACRERYNHRTCWRPCAERFVRPELDLICQEDCLLKGEKCVKRCYAQ